MEHIVFLDRDSVRAKFREPVFPHTWRDFSMTQPAEVVERLRGATIAITNKVPIRERDLEQLPQLRMIAVAATGTDCVDVEYCRRRGIHVANVRNYSNHSVPEHVFTLLLALRRNLISYHNDVREGKWQNSEMFCLLDYPIRELHDSTMGIIGYGALGKAVEKLAQAFGMRTIIAERRSSDGVRSGRKSFEEVLGESDVLTLHCPLNEETRGLIGAPEFAGMKRNAVLINCGRGGLVDEQALVSALGSGQIAGAGVDVLSGEPPKNGNALLESHLPNLLVTPHIAWASLEAMQTLADTLIGNLEAFVAGASS